MVQNPLSPPSFHFYMIDSTPFPQSSSLSQLIRETPGNLPRSGDSRNPTQSVGISLQFGMNIPFQMGIFMAFEGNTSCQQVQ
ncbi:hypothetical protein CEXT_387231 [Caerostris extrusa]|uniref:Uncharacterized protein n=1 Tax=Caerostris extrusa TaxID=172846 RepID=A0AAV4RCL9_CAEEX|nr:hypothetical protein CEXT_387231 [Caerostris extrusa]